MRHLIKPQNLMKSALLTLGVLAANAHADISCRVLDVKEWNTGFSTSNIVVKNNDSERSASWGARLVFAKPIEIERIWSAKSDKTNGTFFDIEAESYNAELEPGEAITFGLKGKKSGNLGKVNCIAKTVGGNPSPTVPPVPSSKPSVRIAVWQDTAVEKEGDVAKIAFVRSSSDGELPINFSLSGAQTPVDGSASANDYTITYDDGRRVPGTRVVMAPGRARVVLQIKATKDGRTEVPEALTFKLTANPNYTLGSTVSGSVRIVDAKNTKANEKVLVGAFLPENGAKTSASGVASLVLQGDNSGAKLNYRFSGLSTEQVTQHIHVAPSGQIVFDVDDERQSGSIANLEWNLNPSAGFTTRQAILDAVLDGKMYVNIHSTRYRAGEIAATLRLNGPVQPTPTPAPTATPPPPTGGGLTRAEIDADVLRFLSQATFGANEPSFRAIRNKINANGSNRLDVYEDWIDAQFNLPQTSLADLTNATTAVFNQKGNEGTNRHFFHSRDAFWTMATSSKDQLRLRTTYALSQILVASDAASLIRRNHLGGADYWDMLGDNAFGNYREMLGDVTRHPVMAQWLSYMNNDKEDKSKGVSPDENYAREIMQLFTFGLLQRRPDGAIKIDRSTNLPLPTYDNKVIQELARVFTGYSISVYDTPTSNKVFNNNQFGRGVGGVSTKQLKWLSPLKMFPAHHDFGRKDLFTDRGQKVFVPAYKAKTVANAERGVNRVLDALVAHSSTAPNVGIKLIQRFVTSNPSGNYVRRVSNAFGERGDMKAVLKAILLDPEARNVKAFESETFGKPKEPLIVFTNVLRAMYAKSQVRLDRGANGMSFNKANQYESGATLLRLGDPSIGQQAFGAPSVFNFYLPDFSPPGELARRSLVAPELQINTESQMYSTFNEIDNILNGGMVRYKAADSARYNQAQLTVKLDFGRLNVLWNNARGDNRDKAAAVVDYLDRYLNSGFLKLSGEINTRETVVDAVSKAKGDERFKLAIYGIVTAPKSLVQR